MKCLVFGGTGFLGAAICNALVGRGLGTTSVSRQKPSGGVFSAAVRSLQATLPHNDAAAAIMETLTPDVVIFCVGAPTVGAAQLDPASEFQSSVQGIQVCLEAIRISPKRARFILVSSAAVYGEGLGRVLNEDAALHPLSFYGHAKLGGEIITEAYRTQYGLDTLILRPFSVFGVQQNKQVVHDLALRMLSNPGGISISGTGDEERDFVRVTDFAALVARTVQESVRVPILNAGTGQGTTLRVLAAGIAARLSPDAELSFSGTEMPGNPRSLVAGTGIGSKIGFLIAPRLEEGLDDFCDWLRSQPTMSKL